MLTAFAPAKLNLFLEVTGKRGDGYHNIESVFLQIDLADVLTVEPTGDAGIVMDCDDPSLPVDDANLVVRAARLLARETGTRHGARFRLRKRIPHGSGLGGGSSDAATALRLANRLWQTGLADAELEQLGFTLGSDIPFFFHGGCCLCRGRGEIIEPLPPFPGELRLGIVLPAAHSDTAAAYRGLRLPGPAGRRSAAAFAAAMAAGDVEAMAAAAFNRFSETVFAALPGVGATQCCLAKELPHGPWLSGSGAGLWFFDPGVTAWQRLRGLDGQNGLRLLEARPFHMMEREGDGADEPLPSAS